MEPDYNTIAYLHVDTQKTKQKKADTGGGRVTRIQ